MAKNRFITLSGTEFADFIKGTKHKDIIYAGAGDDTILSGARKDVIYAGDGNDYVLTRQGHDTVHAGNGDDYIKTGRRRDVVFGGNDNDTIITGRGRDQNKGVDILTHVEFLYFEDDDIYVYLVPQNTAPQANGDSSTTTEDTQLLIDPATLLQNDTDAENDVLTIAAVDGTSSLGAQISFDETGIHYDPQDLFQSLAKDLTLLIGFRTRGLA